MANQEMGPSAPKEPAPVRWLQRRIERVGLRLRVAAVLLAAIWLAAVVLFALIERLVDPETFDSIWLALWWAVQTVTTVGYGDVVPGGVGGKIVGSFLMLAGLSLLAVVTGVITSAFVTTALAQRQAAGKDPIMRKLTELSAQVEAIEAELSRGSKR